MTVTLAHYVVLGAILFGIGIVGVITRRNAIAILMSLELMFNAVNINMVAFSRYLTPAAGYGDVFAVFIITVVAAESVLGLAIILAIFRNRGIVDADEMNLMKW